MKELYIIRHGETDLNRQGIVQGRGVNTSLNSTGRAQAQAFYDKYKEIVFDKIYTSSLIRTHQTVEPFLKQNIPFEQMANLDEMAWGELEGMPRTELTISTFDHLAKEWKSGNFEAKIPGGESPQEVAARLRVALNSILARTNEKTVLICIHGRALRILMCLLLDKSLKDMDTILHANTTLYQVQLQDGILQKVLKTNDISHLEDAKIEQN